MKRREFHEIADLAGCPAWLRDAMTGYLQVMIETARPYEVAIPVVEKLCTDLGASSVLDLASGGGGPWATLGKELRERGLDLSIVLSDVAPSTDALSRLSGVTGVEYLREPVSALDVPASDAGVWTMFTGLHHFSPDEVASIMRSAQERRVGFAAFEATERSLPGFLVVLFIPLFVLALMPFVRPRRVLPLLFTYLPPVLPLLIAWDGFASTLRTYTPAELEEIAGSVRVPDYEWTVSEFVVAKAPIPVLALVGRPTS